MARFEDVCAARLVARQFPLIAQVARADLQSLAGEEAGSRARSLLARLLDRRALTLEQAQWIHGAVERTRRARGLGIYLHLLERERLPRDNMQRLAERLGRDADLDMLGQALLEARWLLPEREGQLRFQARLALERDLAEQARAGLADTLRADAPTPTAASPIDPSMSASGKLRVEDALKPAEAEKIVRRTLSDADGELPGPRFRIPDWVDMSDKRVGKQLSGYRILGRIGAGAMGVVYMADRQDQPERPVALKVLPRDAGMEARARFKREILAQSFFSDDHVIEIYDAGESEAGDPWLAMEFFDGDDLEEALADEAHPLPPGRVLRIAAQVLRGLAAAHEAKIVHRDVKPANILVSHDLEKARLMDFGIAVVGDLGQFEGQVFRSIEGSVTGTPEYMSPEQAGGSDTGPPSDVYSLGVVLYRALSGRLPFESETSAGFITSHMVEDPLPLADASPRARSLPPELHALVERMLSKDASARPTAVEAARELAALATKLPDRRTGGFSLWGIFKRS